MDVRRIWSTKSHRKRGIAIIAACLISAATWLIWKGPLMALSSPDFEEWTQRVGAEPEGLDSLCRSGFDGGGKMLRCDELRHSLPMAPGEATSATVYVDEERNRIRAMSFRIEPFSPSFEATSEGMLRLVSWEEMVGGHVDTGECAPMEAGHGEFGAWKCDDYVVAHSGMMAETRGKVSVKLWIGGTWEELETQIEQRAQSEYRRQAYQLRRAAADYLRAGEKGRALKKWQAAQKLDGRQLSSLLGK